MGDVVIVAYRPHSGCGEELLTLAREHVPYLRRLGLVTDRAPILASATDGVIEVFE
jgi:hypothetical protein